VPQLIDGVGRGDRHGAGTNGAAVGWPDGVDSVLPPGRGATWEVPLDPAARDRQVRAAHATVDHEIALIAAEARALRGRIADVVARSTAPDGATTRHVYQERQVAVEARRAEAAARALVLRLGEWTTARDRGAR